MNFFVNFIPDILGAGFESCSIKFPDDYEGEVEATLIRCLSSKKSRTAVLYVHGFNDYFFQRHLALAINNAGFHFYAIDLRKYGRSHLAHQKWFNLRDVSEYFPELDRAIEMMQEDGIENIILNPHSMGSLVAAAYLNQRGENKNLKAVLFNSPFLEFNESWIARKIGIPIMAFMVRDVPATLFRGGLDENYGKSIYQDEKGEWEYKLAWKNIQSPAVNYGWLRAIYKAQHQLKKASHIQIPVVIFTSDRSYHQKKWTDDIQYSDAVLNVKHMWKYGKKLGDDVSFVIIPNAMHDLALSKAEIRKMYVEKLIQTIQSYSS